MVCFKMNAFTVSIISAVSSIHSRNITNIDIFIVKIIVIQAARCHEKHGPNMTTAMAHVVQEVEVEQPQARYIKLVG